ncbi:hypothetical protein QBC36DRAFT_147965, partial [Triangularia setosa]
WKDVSTQLQDARESYDGIKQGFLGKCNRGWRQIVEHSELARRVIKSISDIKCVSPVLAVLEVILEVMISFDGEKLERMFGDIDIFLATVPGDEKIKEASASLVVAML